MPTNIWSSPLSFNMSKFRGLNYGKHFEIIFENLRVESYMKFQLSITVCFLFIGTCTWTCDKYEVLQIISPSCGPKAEVRGRHLYLAGPEEGWAGVKYHYVGSQLGLLHVLQEDVGNNLLRRGSGFFKVGVWIILFCIYCCKTTLAKLWYNKGLWIK